MLRIDAHDQGVFHFTDGVEAAVSGMTIANGKGTFVTDWPASGATNGGTYNLGRLGMTNCTVTNNKSRTVRPGTGVHTSSGR